MLTLSTRPLAEGFTFLEGPRWHDGWLWMSDMLGGRVHRLNVDGVIETMLSLPTMPSGLGWLPGGDMLVVSMKDHRVLRMGKHGPTLHADLSPLVTGYPNDMVVDGMGNAYVGSFGYDYFGGGEARSAKIVLITPDGQARTVAKDLAFPNGMVIKDGTLIVAESGADRLTAYEIEADGTLTDRRTWAETRGVPDGICLDADGAIWVSLYEAQRFDRIKQGSVTHRIQVPGRAAVACQLGGPDGCTLFCLTSVGAPPNQQARVETAQVMTPGAGSP